MENATDLSHMTVKQLYKMVQEMNIRGRKNMRKADLVKAINDAKTRPNSTPIVQPRMESVKPTLQRPIPKPRNLPNTHSGWLDWFTSKISSFSDSLVKMMPDSVKPFAKGLIERAKNVLKTKPMEMAKPLDWELPPSTEFEREHEEVEKSLDESATTFLKNTLDLAGFMKEKRGRILEEWNGKTKPFKFSFVIYCLFEMKKADKPTEEANYYFRTKKEAIYETTDIEEKFGEKKNELAAGAEDFLARGSGWNFIKVEFLELKMDEFEPISGSSYQELPEYVEKKAVINMQNEDNQCFKWAITRALNPKERNSERKELNWSGINFPADPRKESA